MAMKIFRTNGTTTTITAAEEREIEAYTRSKSLAEIAAEPPLFVRLLDRSDLPPISDERRLRAWLDMWTDCDIATCSPEALCQWAICLGLSETASRQDIINRLQQPPATPPH